MSALTQNFVRFFVLNYAPQFPRSWKPANRSHVLAFIAREKSIAMLDVESFADKHANAKKMRETFRQTGFRYWDCVDHWLDDFAQAANRDLVALERGENPYL